MVSLFFDRIKTQHQLFLDSQKRTKSFLSGFFLFFSLVYAKLIVRIKTKKISSYFKEGIFNFNGIKITGSIFNNPADLCNLKSVFEDTFFVYCHLGDDYTKFVSRNLDLILFEGPYCLKENGVNVTINEGEVVIDCGSWIGDFSAYAAAKGATSYAFEPSSVVFSKLVETVKLNAGKIIPVNLGLGSETSEGRLFYSKKGDTAGFISLEDRNISGSEKVFITSIDSFVFSNKLEKVDFIKADIEGFERYMLMGAKRTLKEFAPKLAICTYHLPDDPVVLKKIILDANPEYNIIQKKKKLFASVPEK